METETMPVGITHADLHNYPLTMPNGLVMAALALARKLVKGNLEDVDIKLALHVAWHVAGYGAGKWDVHDGPPVVGGIRDWLTPERLAQLARLARLALLIIPLFFDEGEK